MPVRVTTNALARTALTALRDAQTDPRSFAEALGAVATVLAAEALADAPTRPRAVQTPLAEAEGVALAERVALFPILRAGLGMVDALLRLIPGAAVWHLGLARDEHTLEPVTYYARRPPPGSVDLAIVLDPMLATGGSACAAIDILRDRRPGRVVLLCAIAAPEGIARLTQCHPEVTIHCAAVDRGLTASGFITPGLGDAGDRQFATEGP